MENDPMKIDEREFLARSWENHLAPEAISADLVARSEEHFKKLLLEYAPPDVAKSVYDIARNGADNVDATLLVRLGLSDAFRRAIVATAKAIRDRTI